jgi:hypothetical protein
MLCLIDKKFSFIVYLKSSFFELTRIFGNMVIKKLINITNKIIRSAINTF